MSEGAKQLDDVIHDAPPVVRSDAGRVPDEREYLAKSGTLPADGLSPGVR